MFTKIIKILLVLGAILIVLFISFSGAPQKEALKKEELNATMINIHGTSDKRLKLFFMATYRPLYTQGKSLPEECLNQSVNWNTGIKKPKLRFEGSSIEGQDDYNITIPVFNKDLRSKCTYTFAGISVRISRMYDDVLYAKVPILTDTPIFTSQGTKSGEVSGGKNTTRIKRPKYTHYFRIPDNTKVSCFTNFYERDSRSNAHATFICRLNHREINSEVERVKNDSIKLDINVDEDLCRYLFKSKKLSIYNYRKGKLSKEEEVLFLSKQGQFQEIPTPAHIKIKNLFIGE